MKNENGHIEVRDVIFRVFGSDGKEYGWNEMTEVSSMAEAMRDANDLWERNEYVYIEAQTTYEFMKLNV